VQTKIESLCTTKIAQIHIQATAWLWEHASNSPSQIVTQLHYLANND